MSSEQSREIIKKYIPLVDFLAAVLGPNSEIVLNDITDLDHSVVYIKNGQLTNRHLGDPASNFVLKIIKNHLDKGINYIANYSGKSKSHPSLRSSTFFLRDKDQQLIGMLCINTDQAPIEQLSKQIDNFKKLFAVKTTPLGEHNKESRKPQQHSAITENFTNSVNSLAKAAVQNKEKELNLSSEYFKQDQKIAVVEQLYYDGYFLLKDSIKVIASYLNSSEPTIYRYLGKIKAAQSKKS